MAQIFQAPLLGLYVQSTDPAYDAVIAAGVVRVLALSRFQWVGGLMETACGTLRGLGHSMNPTVTTLIGACLLRVVWRYTVFEAVGTVESMYWSYPVSWLLTFLIHLIYLERDRRRLMWRTRPPDKQRLPFRIFIFLIRGIAFWQNHFLCVTALFAEISKIPCNIKVFRA